MRTPSTHSKQSSERQDCILLISRSEHHESAVKQKCQDCNFIKKLVLLVHYQNSQALQAQSGFLERLSEGIFCLLVLPYVGPIVRRKRIVLHSTRIPRYLARVSCDATHP